MHDLQHDCDESRLLALLHGDEASAEYQAAADHVEQCTDCCERLTELAADGDTWAEVVESLRADSVDGIGGNESRQVSRTKLDFLRPPSHPEMLGRLGRYEIERIVGTGGMGIVLKGHDSELNRPVAIKVLAPHLAHSGAARQRFAREGRAAAAIVHEHVVSIHNVESEAETPFLVMQLVPGRSLQARVDEFGPLAVKEILRIGIQAAAGLSAAHAQGVVHRDVKPSNILLENDVERVLLTDFGLARVADDASMTRSGIVAGTPHYMSPEQANGAAVDQRSDLFSLGAVLYFMATGHPPFRAERTMAILNRICNDRQRPAWEVNSDIPVELSDLIDRLLEKKPHRRFATAEQVQAELGRQLQRSPLGNRSRWNANCRRWWRRWRQRIAYGSLAAAGIVTAGVFSGVFDSETPSEDPRAIAANVDGGESEAPAGNAVGGEADGGIQQAGELNHAVADVQIELQRLESRFADAAHFQQQGTADWDAELTAVKRDLSRLEQTVNVNPLSKGAAQ